MTRGFASYHIDKIDEQVAKEEKRHGKELEIVKRSTHNRKNFFNGRRNQRRIE